LMSMIVLLAQDWNLQVWNLLDCAGPRHAMDQSPRMRHEFHKIWLAAKSSHCG
jgi:hypothetical protein